MGQPQQTNGSSSRQSKSSKESNGSKAGFDSDQMGMTQERQQEIQASLFKMLGQADNPMVDGNKDESAASSKAAKVTPAQPS